MPSWSTSAASGAGTGATSFSVNLAGTTAGRSLVIMIQWKLSEAATLNSVTCSGETVALHGSPLGSASLDTAWHIASIKKLATGGTKTVTFNFSGSVSGGSQGWLREAKDLAVDESTILDVEASASGNGTVGSINLVTTRAGGLGLCGHSNDNSNSPTVGGGFTFFDMSNINWFGSGADDIDTGSAGTKTPTFTTATANWMLKGVVFLAAIIPPRLPKVNPNIINLVHEPSGYLNKVKSSRAWF